MKKLEKLGKYEIRRELGRGAMGVVYEAFDPFIERTVAIKTILKSAIDKSEAEETFRRFRREARAAGRLSHPGIVSIYEYGEDDDMAFIVMELIRGKELKECFDHEDRFAIRDGIRIVMQLLDALDYSHARGVVHRDIKPANILIADDGQIKIADFGIAKIDSSRATQVGVVLGTPTYMSPEQFMGHEVDHRADIYAAGVILYQFLTGKRPFTGSVITIMHQAVNQDAVPPSQLNHEVSKQLDAVVKKAMAKRPEDRFQSAAEFMEALKAADQASAAPESPRNAPDATLVGARAAVEGERTKEAEQREVLERAQANALAEAEARHRRDAEKKALLTRKIAEIKNEAERVKAAEAVKRKKEAAEQALRAKELLAIMAEHTRNFEEVVAERDATTDAERRMKMEAQRKSEADAEEKRRREKAELAARNQELAEAAKRLEAEETEARAAQARERTRLFILAVGAVLSALLIGALLALLTSPK